jgi:hypothetical protein
VDHLKLEFYPDSGKEIPEGHPPEKGPKVRMTVYVMLIMHMI